MSTSIRNRVARKFDGRLPAVPNPRSLLLKESVFAMGGEQQEDPPKEDELNVRPPGDLPPGPDKLRDIDAVLGDQLLGNGSRILPLRDDAAHVEPVALAYIVNGYLLDEALNRLCFKSVAERFHHRWNGKKW